MASFLTRVLGSNKGASIGRAPGPAGGGPFRRFHATFLFGRRALVEGPITYAAVALAVLGASCSRSRDDKSADAARSEAGSLGPSSAKTSSRAAAAPSVPPGDSEVDAVAAGAASGLARTGDAPSTLDGGKLLLKMDKPIDLGPAGSVVATPAGALFRTRTDELVGFLPGGSPSSAPRRVGLAEDNAGAASEEALGSRALQAGFTGASYAYWITHGKLVRRAFPFTAGGAAGALEVLATDALDGTRVAAETATADAPRRDIALYIARGRKEGDEHAARIWTEGAGSAPLSSDGSGASSVALAASGTGWVAVMLDLRSAMSPVHARTIEIAESGPARLGPDVVIFVGPPPEGRSEVAAAPSPEGPIAFIPFAPDTSSFGLSSLLVGKEPHLDAPVRWRMYPNGIEPAPVAAAVLCGRTWVAYARPSAAAPASAHVLALAPVEKGAFGPELTVAQGFDFMSVSLAPRVAGGGWLTWVGNGRSFIRAVRCG